MVRDRYKKEISLHDYELLGQLKKLISVARYEIRNAAGNICNTSGYILLFYCGDGKMWRRLRNWRGYFVAFFALVWVANQYMSIYNRLRLDIKHEQVEIKADEQKVDDRKAA